MNLYSFIWKVDLGRVLMAVDVVDFFELVTINFCINNKLNQTKDNANIQIWCRLVNKLSGWVELLSLLSNQMQN